MSKEIEEPRLENLDYLPGNVISIWVIKGTFTFHHTSQPAIEWSDGSWEWFYMDQNHRWDGPAQYKDGKYHYWIHGRELTKEEWESDPRRIQWLGEQAMGI